MSTTTFEAVRGQQKTLIEALVPSSQSGSTFRAAAGYSEFRTWASEHPDACFRRFEIRNRFDYSEPEVSNADVIAETMSEEVVVAYPKSWSRYGIEGERDLDDLIDSDWRQIDGAISDIGGQPNFVAGQNRCTRRSVSVDDSGLVVFLSINFEVAFYRSVS